MEKEKQVNEVGRSLNVSHFWETYPDYEDSRCVRCRATIDGRAARGLSSRPGEKGHDVCGRCYALGESSIEKEFRMGKEKRDRMKTGWKTTEFWLTVLPVAMTFALLWAGKMQPADVQSLLPLFGGLGLYSVGRGLSKKG
jgi:hypothetical protein